MIKENHCQMHWKIIEKIKATTIKKRIIQKQNGRKLIK